MPASTRPADQKKWLVEKFELYNEHHEKKTLGQFFPPLYEEYFSKWPPTPTEEELGDAGGKSATAIAKVRTVEEQRIYRWMFNRSRSKHGSCGKGSSASLNLTAGLPKKKAAVQTYVKHFWEAKVKQEVIDTWAPTPETDLFGEIDIGEDQIAWEEMTPMERNIPLWFRMEIGRKLYEAESDEVKAEVDRLREQAKEDAITARASSNTFATEEERLKVMKKFDDNFAKLSHSLGNLCSNIKRDFGFHTSIIVGGPLVRENGRLGAYTYESHGSVHKQLTFSEHMGQSYESGVSEKFVEYLNLCIAKDERKLYTLKPIAVTAEPPLPISYVPVVPAFKPPPISHATGPLRTSRTSTQARMRTGPMPPALKARILANIAKSNANKGLASVTQVALPPIEPGFVIAQPAAEPAEYPHISGTSGNQQPLFSRFLGNNVSNGSSHTTHTSISPDILIGAGDAIASPSLEINASDRLSYASPLPNTFDVKMADSVASLSLENDVPEGLSYASSLPDAFDFDQDISETLSYASSLPDVFDFETDFSDSLSYTSTLPDDFDVGMDDSAPSATGPWTVIDHFTGEIIVDDEISPTVPVVPGAPFDSAIQVEIVPALGIPALVQTPLPTLLFVDQDERPDWLIRSANKHLQYTPYYMCLNRVVDLFFAQEARLGYPIKSPHQALPSSNRPLEVAVFMKHARDFTRGDDVNEERFGTDVIKWWLTIQPTTRKTWPPTYGPLPEDFSFDYFNRGGPNGVFLMILCLTWWANALTTTTDLTDFKLIVHDVCWVLEQVASRT